MSTSARTQIVRPLALTPVPDRRLQRACACGNEREDERDGVVQRKPAGAALSAGVPPIVGQVLADPGQPLEAGTRAFMEPRFGHDFRHVRVHTDGQAGESARAVGALAYTVGEHVVFGTGHYAPGTYTGRHLLAHELAHTIQQVGTTPPGAQADLHLGAASTPAEAEADAAAEAVVGGWEPARVLAAAGGLLQRSCSSDPQCTTGMPRSLRWAVTRAEGSPAQKAKSSRRAALCGKTPPDPACTGDGHGAPAPQLTSLVSHYLPQRLALISGIFIDKDIPADYGAYTLPCSAFTPPLPGGECTFAPQRLEDEARLYNTTDAQQFQYGNRARWLNVVLQIFQHESEHARVNTSPTAVRGLDPATNGYAKSDLSEIGAILSEFHVVYTRAQAKPEPARSAEIEAWYQPAIQTRGECIQGNVADVRCFFDCAEADQHIKEIADFTTGTWNSYERLLLHTELRQPKWGLNWPVEPPSSVSVEDLPNTIPTVDVEDLPKAK